MNDPLEERDDAEREVQTKRVLEAMDEDAQVDQLRRVLESDDARDFLWRVMGWCGIFADPMNSNFGTVAYGLGKAAIGKKLLVEINVANPQAWLAMQLKSAEAAAAASKAAAMKKMRKGRST